MGRMGSMIFYAQVAWLQENPTCWEITVVTLSQFGKKIGQEDAQHFGNEAEIQQRQVSFAAFDRADERAVQFAAPAQFGLRPFPGDPLSTDALPQVSKE